MRSKIAFFLAGILALVSVSAGAQEVYPPQALTPDGNFSLVGTLTVSGPISAPAWGANGILIKEPASTVTDLTSSGTIADNAVNAIAQTTLAYANPTTATDASSFLIANAPANGTNSTITNFLAFKVAAGNAKLLGNVGIGGNFGTNSNVFNITPGANANTFTSATEGKVFNISAATQNDGATSGTVAAKNTAAIGQITYTSTSARTITDATSLLITGPPICSTNTTCTNGPFSIKVVTGASLFGGDIQFSGNLVATSATSGIVLKRGSNGRTGTFVCTSGGTIVVSNTSYAITDTVGVSLNTLGGSISAQPFVIANSAGVSFSMKCATSDTSTYNYILTGNAS